MTEQKEKEFVKQIALDRMMMHFDENRKRFPQTPEKRLIAMQRQEEYQEVFKTLDEVHQEMLDRCFNDLFADVATENELYYQKGFEDGIRLDQFVKKCKAKED